MKTEYRIIKLEHAPDRAIYRAELKKGFFGKWERMDGHGTAMTYAGEHWVESQYAAAHLIENYKRMGPPVEPFEPKQTIIKWPTGKIFFGPESYLAQFVFWP